MCVPFQWNANAHRYIMIVYLVGELSIYRLCCAPAEKERESLSLSCGGRESFGWALPLRAKCATPLVFLHLWPWPWPLLYFVLSRSYSLLLLLILLRESNNASFNPFEKPFVYLSPYTTVAQYYNIIFLSTIKSYIIYDVILRCIFWIGYCLCVCLIKRNLYWQRLHIIHFNTLTSIYIEQ